MPTRASSVGRDPGFGARELEVVALAHRRGRSGGREAVPLLEAVVEAALRVDGHEDRDLARVLERRRPARGAARATGCCADRRSRRPRRTGRPRPTVPSPMLRSVGWASRGVIPRKPTMIIWPIRSRSAAGSRTDRFGRLAALGVGHAGVHTRPLVGYSERGRARGAVARQPLWSSDSLCMHPQNDAERAWRQRPFSPADECSGSTVHKATLTDWCRCMERFGCSRCGLGCVRARSEAKSRTEPASGNRRRVERTDGRASSSARSSDRPGDPVSRRSSAAASSAASAAMAVGRSASASLASWAASRDAGQHQHGPGAHGDGGGHVRHEAVADHHGVLGPCGRRRARPLRGAADRACRARPA